MTDQRIQFRGSRWLPLAFAIITPAFGSAGWAQDEQVDQEAGRISDIIVTARKRDEKVQDIPISVSAFSGTELDARGLTRINEIQEITPNLTFYSYTPFGGSSNNATVYLRGIGQSDFAPTTEPGVGLYVDGVYYGRSVGSVLSLIDIERVEVLRGPQGTLFGRNTTGGAISITSRKPHEKFELGATLTLGSDERADVTGTINLPLGRELFLRLTAGSFNQDGYVEHERTGQDFGDEDRLAGRMALRWLPGDDFRADLSFDYSRDRENGPATVYSGAVFIGPSMVPPTGNIPYTNNVFLAPLTGCDGTPGDPAGSIGNPACVNDQFLGQKNGDPEAYYSDTDLWGAALDLGWTLSRQLEVRSITAYRDLDSEFAFEGDDTPVFLTATEDALTQEQFTQELQLLGSSIDDDLEWIVGLFYFQEEGRNLNIVRLLPVTFQSGGAYDNESAAAFAQATWHAIDRLHLTAGLRYTEDTKKFLPDQVVLEDRTGGSLPPGTPVLPSIEAENDADDLTPMFNIAYDWTDRLMTYLSYSEGFKGGGFHQRVFPPLPSVPQFDPEFVTSYEAGFKFASEQGDLIVNGAAFYSEYDDLQVTVFTSVAPVVDNAGDATIAGFELESQWIPVDSWFFQAAVGYLDAEYDSVDPGTGLSGNEELARVPEWTLSASLSKEFQLGDTGRLTPRIDWSYRSKIWFDTFNTPFMVQDDYHLANASIAWDSPQERYSLVLGVNNLADEEYLNSVYFQTVLGTINELRARGREWYLRLDYRY